MKNSRVISVLALIALLMILLVQNTQVVTLKIYFWEIAMSQIILILLVLLIGFAAGYVVARFTGKARMKEEPRHAVR